MTSFTQRISNLASTSAKAKLLAQNDNDVVIVAAVRSAITKVRACACVCAAQACAAPPDQRRCVWERRWG